MVFPQRIQPGEQLGSILRFGKPVLGFEIAFVMGELAVHGHAAAVKPLAAQALGGFIEQAVQGGKRTFAGAKVRLQHMLVADGTGLAGCAQAQIFAVQKRVEARAFHPAPDGAHAQRAELPELFHRVDAERQQALFHAVADARNVAGLQVQQLSRQIFARQHGEPVGLLHVGRELGEQRVHRQADGRGEAFTDLFMNGVFYLLRQPERALQLALGAGEAAGDFVDGHDFFDRHAAFHRLDHLVVILHIAFVAGQDEGDVGAQTARLVHRRAGADAARLGRVAGRQHAGAVGLKRNDGHRLAAQFGPLLLLARGKERVEVEEEPGELGHEFGIGLWGLGGRGQKHNTGCHSRESGNLSSDLGEKWGGNPYCFCRSLWVIPRPL